MTESVAELLGRLRFAGGPVETLYLNQPRVKESFVGQLGAIESFTRGVAKEGSVEAPVIKIGAGVTSESGVTWNLADPTAQLLVLHAALEMHGAVRALDGAVPGELHRLRRRRRDLPSRHAGCRASGGAEGAARSLCGA
jgi:hypothetical protein